MKAFWWFRENSIAGMARPGFNYVHWYDLPFEEAVLLGWLGQHSSGSETLESFRAHLNSYAPKIFSYYKFSEEDGFRMLDVFKKSAGLIEVLERLAARTKAFESFSVDDGNIHFKLSATRLQWEIDYLKKHGIQSIVCLTEKHHNKDTLSEHFELHHFSIADLGAPKLEQAVQLAEVLAAAKRDRTCIAVHCLAGIGRTSTMLMAAHMKLGEDPKTLEALLTLKNPSYSFSGSQADFIRGLVYPGDTEQATPTTDVLSK